MKALIYGVLCLASAAAFAAQVQEGQITMAAPQVTADPAANIGHNFTEAALQYTSINNGSAFATVALMREWDNGFAIGARGFLPMEYTRQTQAYLAQVNARFILLNDANQMYIEGNITQGFFNTADNDTAGFSMFGADYGYMRKINPQIGVGASMGVQYSRDRVANNEGVNGYGTFYNTIALTGAYYF